MRTALTAHAARQQGKLQPVTAHDTSLCYCSLRQPADAIKVQTEGNHTPLSSETVAPSEL